MHHAGVIPEGGTYITGVVWDENSWSGDATNMVTYTAGQNFPETPQPLDRYIYGDYTYVYSASWGGEPHSREAKDQWSPENYEGWLVTIYDSYTYGRTEYGTILHSINGKT